MCCPVLPNCDQEWAYGVMDAVTDGDDVEDTEGVIVGLAEAEIVTERV